MHKLLWKILPPYEVRLTIEEIEAFFSEGKMCKGIVKPKAIALAKELNEPCTRFELTA